MKKEPTPKEQTETTHAKDNAFYEAVGRRKTSSARVRLYVVNNQSVVVAGTNIEKGALFVNSRAVENYFPGEVMKKLYQEPFRTTNTMNRFAVSIKVAGGGLNSQLGAVIHGIARALEKVDKEKFRPILKKRGFLTRDQRAKERRKAGFAQCCAHVISGT
jgi:small subunit ribosomal protein S9